MPRIFFLFPPVYSFLFSYFLNFKIFFFNFSFFFLVLIYIMNGKDQVGREGLVEKDIYTGTIEILNRLINSFFFLNLFFLL
ncbi:hypothetical protein RhiirA1_248224 [Rhizophagus irregularis]|uniref:Uncharacterized protein n=1 Tax=Rhizophagus irregularis TaxID=588596 RepID=A0A2N0RI37_9GLOM|nr:hypothetical protein RhiirA1_248224 [Rhizophagus irregularis]